MEEHDKIELRSEEVQEILGTPPNSVVRWGTVVVLLSVILMGWLSWWIRYPDKIKVPITLTAANPPVKLVAQTDGYIAKLTVNNEQRVDEGTLLAVMQSAADYEDVDTLDATIAKIQEYGKSQFLNLELKRGLQIGNLQTAYAVVLKNLESFQYSSRQNFRQQSKFKLKQEIIWIKDAIQQDYQKLSISKSKEVEQKAILERHKKLYADNLISYDELKAVSARLQTLRVEQGNIEARIKQKNNQIKMVETDIAGNQQAFQGDNNKDFIDLKSSITAMRSEIDEWKAIHLIPAPVDGEISFHNFLSEKQYFKQGEEVMSIVPPGSDSIMGIIFIPSIDKPKIAEGQKVIIKLASYAYPEYGTVGGRVVSVGRVPRNNRYPVTVALPKGLRTTHGIDLTFDQGMQGVAEIVTEKKRFFEKVIENILERVE